MTEIEEWLKNYQEDLVTAPICNKELILQWIDFYKASKLPEEIKTPLLQMLQEGTFMGAPVSDRVIIAQEIIPTIKKLIEMGLWDNVVKLLFISCSVCNGISEREKRQKNKAQTENACKEKRVRLIKRIVPLEGFLREVEFHWHPNGDTTNERFSNHSRQMALKKIFNLHEAEIMQEFEKQRI